MRKLLFLKSLSLILLVPLGIADPVVDVDCDVVCDFEQTIEKESKLVGEIWRMNRQDRFERIKAISIITGGQISPEDQQRVGNELFAIINQNDRTRADRLKEILKSYSWAEMAEVEEDLPNRAWLIAQHADHDPNFQLSVLNDITPLVKEGKMDGQTFTLMSDEISMEQNGYQIYGTQYECENGKYSINNITDRSTVDDRRKEYGLQPLKDYLANLPELVGPCT